MQSRFIKTLKLKNFLSYGEAEEIVLQPLNVLIGPNASGKSNLIEALTLLQLAPTDLTAAIRRGGGIQEWLWKGGETNPTAEIEAIVDYPEGIMSLRYRLCFTAVGQRFEIIDEVIENSAASINDEVIVFYRHQEGRPILLARTTANDQPGTNEHRILRTEELTLPWLNKSVLSRLKNEYNFPEITYLGDKFGAIRLYTDWNLGRGATPRLPQNTAAPNDFLLEDTSNLGLILNDLQYYAEAKQALIENFRKFYDTADDIITKVQGGTIQVFVHEKGLSQAIPATRLSDGTLRYLALLTILCHPTPPPLLCLEEPELGLHPDILPTIAELLLEASQRTQLIVTTHSDILISALTTQPETVLVCERDEGGSHLRRLEAERLKKWLEDYSLGELWRMGELGGTRW